MKIETNFQNSSVFHVSFQESLVLFLIKKELEGTKLMNDLTHIGYDPMLYATDLAPVILPLMHFKAIDDALWDWYQETMKSFAALINLEDKCTSNENAFEFYLELRKKQQAYT